MGLVTAIAGGMAVYTTPLAPYSPGGFAATFQLSGGGQNVKFDYIAGGGAGHTLTITDFVWEWQPCRPPFSPPN